MTEPLRFLLVDDQANEDAPAHDTSSSLARVLRNEGHEAVAVSPPEVNTAHLEDRDLILVDFRITECWEPEAAPLVQQPRDGLAVVGVLRSWLEEKPPVGLALYSAKLSELAQGMTLARAEHVAARLHGLEWAFSKSRKEGLPAIERSVIALGEGVREVRAMSTSTKHWEQHFLEEVLKLPADAPWSQAAARQLEVAQLPRDELIEASGGLVALRWLAHRVIPYPGVLIGPSYVAALLGVDASLVTSDTGLGQALQAHRYTGALGELVGHRWWRAGIQHQVELWESSELPIATERTVSEIGKLTGQEVAPALGMVACVNEDFEPSGELASKLDCVRLRPDDWPVFAAPAWMRINEVLNNELAHYVDPADVVLLEQ
jgi:CheY-like chemotaxis protein